MVLSKRIEMGAMSQNELKRLREEHPDSYAWVVVGEKTLVVGAGLEAACVAGALKAKNPVVKAAFGVGAAISMFIAGAGGYIMGTEAEAVIREDEAVRAEQEPIDVEASEGEPEDPDDDPDDGIIIE